MIEFEAKNLEVETSWNGKANVCVHCGRVPETFYVATGHDHTDFDIRWCPCRAPAKTEAELLRVEIASLKQQLEVYEANAARFIDADKSMQQQLAAAQATNSKLREALDSLYEYSSPFNHLDHAHCECDPYVGYTCSGCRFVSSEQAMGAKEALALPNDDTALKQYRDSVIEECANVCEGGSFLHENAPDALFAKACSKAIRKLSSQGN